MRLRQATLATLVLLVLVPAGFPQGASNQSKMSAREIFYAAPKAKKKVARPPAPPAPVPAPAPAPVPAPPAPAPLDVAKTRPPTPPPAPAPPVTPAPPVRPPEGQAEFIPAAIIDPPRLGLRCSVLKREGETNLFEVDPEIVFRSGDRIRLRVESNDDGFLYVILRGSSGVWKPLFPTQQVDGGSNRILGGRPYDVPEGHVFTFDDQPGEEKLFVIVSRTPVEDLDSLIYDLGSGAPAQTPRKAPEKTPSPEKLLLAQNLIDIDDSLVNRLRNAHARDLIIEKVDENSSDTSYGKESAVYAVAASADTGSRVVVDLTLTHR